MLLGWFDCLIRSLNYIQGGKEMPECPSPQMRAIFEQSLRNSKKIIIHLKIILRSLVFKFEY